MVPASRRSAWDLIASLAPPPVFWLAGLMPWPVLAATLDIGSTDIGGQVTSSNGPEAGVWVIAETDSLPTKIVKIAVTDDAGQYLVPDLPGAEYHVFVRATASSTPQKWPPPAGLPIFISSRRMPPPVA